MGPAAVAVAVLTVVGNALDFLNAPERLIFPVIAQEPSRTLGHELDSDAQNESKDDSEGNDDPPGAGVAKLACSDADGISLE